MKTTGGTENVRGCRDSFWDGLGWPVSSMLLKLSALRGRIDENSMNTCEAARGD